jgi:kynurenine 3-monooxygenase
MRIPAGPTMRAAAPQSAAIIGAGPAGLLTALMLAQRGWQCHIFDARQAPPAPSDPLWGAGERSYQLGLNGRGQRSLRQFGAMRRVSAYAASVNGRLSFDPKSGKPVETRLKPPGSPGAEKSYVTRVLQRDRLQACLLEELAECHPSVRIDFGVACRGVDMTGSRPVVQLCKPSSDADDADECDVETDEEKRMMPFDLVVGADGVRSAVRESLASVPGSNTRTVRFDNDNERQYKTVALHPSLVPGTASDLNWGARNKALELGMDALPTMEGEMVAVLLCKPGSPVYDRVSNLGTTAEASAFFQDTLPQVRPYLREEDLARFIEQPMNRLPSFQLVEGDLHQSLADGGVLVLGDAIKAVKPYFGQVNSRGWLQSPCPGVPHRHLILLTGHGLTQRPHAPHSFAQGANSALEE